MRGQSPTLAPQKMDKVKLKTGLGKQERRRISGRAPCAIGRLDSNWELFTELCLELFSSAEFPLGSINLISYGDKLHVFVGASNHQATALRNGVVFFSISYVFLEDYIIFPDYKIALLL